MIIWLDFRVIKLNKIGEFKFVNILSKILSNKYLLISKVVTKNLIPWDKLMTSKIAT